MKRLLVALLCVLVLLPALACAEDAAPVTADQQPAVDAAKNWLAGIDAGAYGKSWDGGSAYFRDAISQKDWETALTAFRKPLGALVSRQIGKAKSLTTLPGAPDGTYVVMEFASSFANKKDAFETVCFSREADGSWRAAGYFIR
ncbi:DUF4019 domain-containing protein [Solidesulfovibrio sp.]|uniref:DUF4019 domain-containing protein n=1 Tax=Solidesulfovibrio sp. TaxID=2910990 RepID=UPI002B2056C0|nr:DUF4019 domain-containing protein [Solidesulfovibrio sp.]MEA5089051.1 DUF4019 domain-containing protein [Solidesulfovibrio sp.]HML63119.1 DUF4019 domain-containing protein [Solidesulfovibrio sp.]